MVSTRLVRQLDDGRERGPVPFSAAVRPEGATRLAAASGRPGVRGERLAKLRPRAGQPSRDGAIAASPVDCSRGFRPRPMAA